MHPELLAGRPKLDVLFAELRFEEDAEGGFSICGRGKEEVQRQAAACLLARRDKSSAIAARPFYRGGSASVP